jgi:hypothetical protein
MHCPTQCIIKVRTTSEKKKTVSYFTNLVQFSEGIPNVNIVNYLAINERAARNTNLHPHVYNSHHVWMDYNDIET